MSAARAVAVDVRDLVVAFGGVTAIDGIDVAVRTGEALAILGPNGSGKTTLLNSVTGFVRPTGGRISLWGEDVTRVRAYQRSRRGIGRTFQNLRFLPRITVFEMLQFGWYQRDPRAFGKALVVPLGLRKAEDRVRTAAESALHMVDLRPTLLDKPVASLAQGQLKLLDVARALMAEPKLLMLDEPTSGLSGEDVAQMRQLVTQLRNDGITLIVVEHDIRFVLSFADRVVVMDAGRKLAEGDPGTTMRLPEVVEAYIGPKVRLDSTGGSTDGRRRAEANVAVPLDE